MKKYQVVAVFSRKYATINKTCNIWRPGDLGVRHQILLDRLTGFIPKWI
jgi:hypothetical protein